MAYMEFAGELDAPGGKVQAGFTPFTGELDKPKGFIDRAISAVKGIAAADGDPSAGTDGVVTQGLLERAPNPDPDNIGIMAGVQPAPGRSQTSPLRPEVIKAAGSIYDAATPDQRAQMVGRDGAIGAVLRDRADRYAEFDAGQPLDAQKQFDPRAEARSTRLARDGMDPTLAPSWGAEGARRGELPGDEISQATKSTFDFDAQKKYNEDPFFKNPLVRGAVKGVEGFKQGALGLNQFVADTIGADDSAAGFKRMAKQSSDFTDAMGESKNYAQATFEGAIASIGQQLPALIGGAMTGSEPAVLGAMFVQSFGQQYSEGRAAGQSIGDATTRASQMAALEVIGEKFGLGHQMSGIKAIAKGNADEAVKMMAKAALHEVPGEELTTVGQFFVDKKGAGIGLKTEAGIGDLFTQMRDTIAQTLVQGALMTGGAKALTMAGNATLNSGNRQIANAIDGVQLDQGSAQAVARAAVDPQNYSPTTIAPQETVAPAPAPAPVKHASEQAIDAIGAATTVDDAIAATVAAVSVPTARAEAATARIAPTALPSDQQQAIADLERSAGLSEDQNAATPAPTTSGSNVVENSALQQKQGSAGDLSALDASAQPPAVIEAPMAQREIERMRIEAMRQSRPMTSAMAREITRLSKKTPASLTTAQLELLAAHHPSEEIRSSSLDMAMSRRNFTTDSLTPTQPLQEQPSASTPEINASTDLASATPQRENEKAKIAAMRVTMNSPMDAAEIAASEGNSLPTQRETEKAKIEGMRPFKSPQSGQPGRKPSSGAQAARERLHATDPFLSFLAREGVSSADRADTGADRGNGGNRMVPGYGPIYRKSGLRLDELAQHAVEEGHLTQADVDSAEDTGGTRKLADMIRRAVSGREVIVPAARLEQNAESKAASRADDELMAEAARLGIQTDSKSMDAVYDAVVAHHTAGEAAMATDDRLQAMLDEIDASYYGKPLTDEDIDGFFRTQQESSRGTQENTGVDARGRNQEDSGESRHYELEGETASEAEARITSEERRAENSRAASIAEDRKSQADAEVGDFALTGSDRSADLAAAQGQGSLLTQPNSSAKTDTPAFRRWFGESKVVDAEGNPLPMYHGTSSAGFGAFDTYASNYGLMGMGGYFTADPSVASSYTSKGRGESQGVYKAFLSIKNPLDMDGKADISAWKKAFDGVEDYHESGDTNEAWYRSAEDMMADQQLPKYEGAELMQDALRAMGHDGITHIGGGRVKANEVKHRVYVVFDAEQIKSATGNNGEFDPANADIAFSRAKNESDFVRTPDGSLNFGEITGPMATAMKRQAGVIRLERGNDQYGEHHIELGHGYQIRKGGFDSVADFVEKSLSNVQSVWKPGKTSQLVVLQAEENGSAVFIELKPARDEAGDYYRVNSAFPVRGSYLEKKQANEGWIRLWDDRAVSSEASGQPPQFAVSPPKPGGEVTIPSGQSDGNLTQKSDADKPAFRRGLFSMGMEASELSKEVTRIAENWKNAPGIKVVQSVDMLPFDAPDDARGAYAKGRVWLVADNTHSAADAQFVLFHETLGHAGLRGVFGSDLAAALNDVALKNAGIRQAAAQWRADNADIRTGQTDSRWNAIAIEEALADMAGAGKEFKGIDKFLAAVQRALRSIGLGSVANWMENATNAEALAVLARARNHIVNRDQQSVFGAQEARAFNRQSGDEARFARPPAGAWNVEAPGKMDDFIYTMQDKQIDTKRVVQAIREANKKIHDHWDPYLQEELFHGRSAKQVSQFLSGELRPLLQDMQMRGVSMGDLEEYLHMRHAEERNNQIAKVNPNMQDGGAGVNTVDARAYLAGLSAAKRNAYEKLAAKVDAINSGTQQILIDSGLEKASTIAAWNGAYQYYVPLSRDEGGQGVGQGFSVRGSSSKRAMGSTKAVVNILANIAMQRERTIVRAEKNRVSTALYGLSITAPNPEFWLPVNPDKIDANKRAELAALGLNPLDVKNLADEPKQQYIDPKTGLVAERVNPFLRSADNVFATRVGGEDRYVFFNENDERAMRMVSAMKNLDADQLGLALSYAAKGTRYFSAVNTQYNPIFGMLNIARDTQEAMFNLTTTPIAGKQAQVAAYIPSALRGIYIELRDHRAGRHTKSTWAAEFEEFQNEGGATGYRDMFTNSKERADALNGEFKAITQGTAKAAGKAMFGWLSDYNEALENSVRLAAYRVAKENGMSKQRAASLAKNLTVNFNRKGQIATHAGALFAFFNAAVQGSARLLETLRGPKGKAIIVGGLLLGAMQASILAIAGFDDDEPSDFVKDRNFIIPIGDGKYLTWPYPLGLKILPNIGRNLTEFALSGLKKPGGRMVSLLMALIDTFNPVGGTGTFSQLISPTVLDPFVALGQNKDWTGRQIFKEDRSSLAPTPGYLRKKDTASKFSQVLSRYINLSSGGTAYTPGLSSPTPDHLDYLISQATGGVGREILKAEQTVSSHFNGDELPTYKIPVLGRFYGDTKEPASVAGKFYENIKALNVHEAEIKGRRKDHGDVASYVAENPDAVLFQAANNVELQIQHLAKRKREMVERGAAKEDIKAVDQQMNTRMLLFNQRVKSLSSQGKPAP